MTDKWSKEISFDDESSQTSDESFDKAQERSPQIIKTEVSTTAKEKPEKKNKKNDTTSK